MPNIPRDVLSTRLAEFLHSREFPGFKTGESRIRFVEKLDEAQKKLRALGMRKFAGSVDPHCNNFHPLKAVIQLWDNGDGNEALWLLFLTIHFGQDVPETIRLFYGKLGVGSWHWESVDRDPEALLNWMRTNRNRLRKLKFGNHRKRRIMDPEHKRGTWTVIRSFLNWVAKHGQGSPMRAFDKFLGDDRDPEGNFDRLYQALSVFDFGRTARFDFLCLLGNLHIFNLSPRHCYLPRATGPKEGALLMITGRRHGKFEPEIDGTVRTLTTFLGVSVEAMEDALCNWQKAKKSKKQSARLGYLSSCSSPFL